MQLRIDRKLFCLFLAFTGTVIIGCVAKNAFIGLACAIIQVIMICWKAKLSFLSLFTFIINYCLFPQFIAYNNGNVYGLLGLGYIKIYFFELCYCCFVLNLITFSFIVFTDFILNEKRIYESNYNFTNITVISLSIVAVVLTLLIFPNISFGFNSANRFTSGIIPFSGWSCIPFFLLSLGLLSKKKKKIVYSSTGFVCFWYTLHGERVDVVGMLFFFAMIFFNSEKHKKKRMLMIIIAGMAVVAILLAIGTWREGDRFSARKLISSLFIQGTACDVTNVFNAAVDILYKGNTFRGITYLSYLINCIPMLPDRYSFQNLIEENYKSAGGGLFFAEPIANFGFVFMAIQTFLIILLVYIVTRKQTRYRSLLYAELCLSVFRTAWYGLNYSIVTILYFIPIVLALNRCTLEVRTRLSQNKSKITGLGDSAV